MYPRRTFLAILTAFLFSASAALAMNFQPKPYDATYTMQFGGQTYNQRRVSDGAGKERSELSTPNGTMINIQDTKNNVSYTVMPNRKMALKRTMDKVNRDKDKNFVVNSYEKAKEVGAKPLGKKVIDGHPCQGFQYTHRGNVSEAWIGEDIGTLVLMKSTSPDGNVSMRLTSIKPFDGNQSWFAPPKDYKVVEMPSFGMFRQAGMRHMMKRTQAPQANNPNQNAAPANPFATMMQQGGVANGMPEGLNSFSRGGMTPEKMQQLKDFANTMKQRFGNANQPGQTF